VIQTPLVPLVINHHALAYPSSFCQGSTSSAYIAALVKEAGSGDPDGLCSLTPGVAQQMVQQGLESKRNQSHVWSHPEQQ